MNMALRHSASFISFGINFSFPFIQLIMTYDTENMLSLGTSNYRFSAIRRS
jgi:hypothetical protein